MSWRQITLGDAIRLKRGHDLPASQRVFGEVPIISSSGITGYHNVAKVEGPGVVTGRYGTLGEVHYVEGAYWPLNTALYVDDFKGNNPKFIAYLLSTLELGGQNAAGAVPGVNRNALHQLPITIPAHAIQLDIVSKLQPYDDLIETNRRRIALLEESARLLYREWFVDFRFPGYQHTPMKETEFGAMPAGWAFCQLDEICSKITDGAHASPPTVDDGYPMASVKDMHDFGINVASCRKISQEAFMKLCATDCKVAKGDVLVAKDGSYLKHIFLNARDEEIVLLSSIAILRPNNENAQAYLVYTLKSTEVNHRIRQCVSGVAIPRIVLKDFRKFKILYPTNNVLQVWAEKVMPIIDLCNVLNEQNRALAQARDELLPKLMSGELRL